MKVHMKKIFLSLLMFTSIKILGIEQEKEWDILVYMAAANSLSEFSYKDIAEMVKQGSSANVNVLVYWTVLKADNTSETKKIYIHKGSIEQIGETIHRDSGDVATLKEALDWALTDYPCKKLAVIFWDHGSGILNPQLRNKKLLKGICFDDCTNNYLNDWDCQEALRYAMNKYRNGNKIEIVACDACLMAGIELAKTLEPCVKYLVSSQEVIPGDGYDYARVLKDFEQASVKTGDLVADLAEAYQATYENQDDFTLSAIDLREINRLVENINKVSLYLAKLLKGRKRKHIKRIINRSISPRYCLNFQGEGYRDLYAFYRNLLSHIRHMKLSSSKRCMLTNYLRQGLNLMNFTIIKNVHSKSRQGAHGLSIYLPGSHGMIDPSYFELYWTKQTSWIKFLQAYIK